MQIKTQSLYKNKKISLSICLVGDYFHSFAEKKIANYGLKKKREWYQLSQVLCFTCQEFELNVRDLFLFQWRTKLVSQVFPHSSIVFHKFILYFFLLELSL